jgi:hypothetical protein
VPREVMMEPITDSDRELWGDLARRLCAAYISYRNGNRSIDYTLKRYVPEDGEIGDLWIEIARKVGGYASEMLWRNIRS